MIVRNKLCADQALFESTSADGTHWLFVVRSDDGWAITRNGERVAAGVGHRWSIDSGVRKFLCLTADVAGRQGAQCNTTPVVKSAGKEQVAEHVRSLCYAT